MESDYIEDHLLELMEAQTEDDLFVAKNQIVIDVATFMDVVNQLKDLREDNIELKYVVKGLENNRETLVYNQIDIVDEQGDLIASLDPSVSKELINAAIKAFIKSILIKEIENESIYK